MIHATSGHCGCCPDYRPPPARLKTLSTTWPWDHGKLTPGQTIDHLRALGTDEVCIRAPVYFAPLQPQHMAPASQAFHDELVALAMDEGMRVSLWPVVSLYNPELMADRIAEYAEHYSPDRIFLDAERHWVTGYISNLPRFLNRLAAHIRSGRIRCPIGLGSYRRADLHKNMNWQVWLRHREGLFYTIDFLAHQLYPIGWTAPTSYADQARKDVLSHEAEVQKSGRSPMKWFPWMPAFSESGWTASGPGVRAIVDALHAFLGDRLMGLNWWSLDQDMVLRGPAVDPRLQGVYDYIRGV